MLAKRWGDVIPFTPLSLGLDGKPTRWGDEWGLTNKSAMYYSSLSLIFVGKFSAPPTIYDGNKNSFFCG